MVEFAGLEDYLTDQGLESGEGIWIKFPSGMRFNIHRAGGSNTAFAMALQKKIRPHRKAFERGTMDPDLQSRIMRELYVDHVILGWDGVNDKHGNPVAFTKQNVMDLLIQAPDLFDDIQAEAGNVGNFLASHLQEEIEELGNS